MNQQNTYQRFKQDKRLKDLDPERIELLTGLAAELSNAPNDQKMTKFLSVMQTASQEQISFTGPEQELLFSVLTENMSAEDRKKAELIRRLASQMRK